MLVSKKGVKCFMIKDLASEMINILSLQYSTPLI